VHARGIGAIVPGLMAKRAPKLLAIPPNLAADFRAPAQQLPSRNAQLSASFGDGASVLLAVRTPIFGKGRGHQQ
jgi:hypothetical protein